MVTLQRVLTVLVLASLVSGCGGGSSSAGDSPMAIGRVQRSELLSPLYPAFATTYDTVTIEQNFVDLLRVSQEGIDVVVLLGSWCGDSKREVPRFLKIADLAGISGGRISLIGVDRSKKAGDLPVESYAIEKVPTFIFLKNGKEIGRIVETPAATMEADMLTIFAGAQSPAGGSAR